jgi:hypothetical protein
MNHALAGRGTVSWGAEKKENHDFLDMILSLS